MNSGHYLFLIILSLYENWTIQRVNIMLSFFIIWELDDSTSQNYVTFFFIIWELDDSTRQNYIVLWILMQFLNIQEK